MASFLSHESPVWALTAYYNPMRYRTRLDNFRRFRENLVVPLVVAELSFGDHWDLTDSDADIVARVAEGSVMWQKERLLNVAFQHLPHHVSHVAWLDCDVILENANWPNEGVDALRSTRLLQLFTHLIDLGDGQSPQSAGEATPIGTSVGYLVQTGDFVADGFRPSSTLQMRQTCFGLAWMASRGTISAHGFYDAMVMGSGDRAMACAALERYEDAIATIKLNKSRRKHYLNWARAFHSTVEGKVAALPGRLFHFWHGELVYRRYSERHEAFACHEFDPESDLVLTGSGAWRWKEGRDDLQTLAQAYFRARHEDGNLL